MKNFSFTGHFKVFGVISILLVVVGLAGLILLPFGVTLFNFDIDFLGGVTMQYDIHTELTPEVENELRDIVREVAGTEPSAVTSAGSGTEIIIKTLEIDTELREAVFDRVAERFGLSEEDHIASNYVSASVGSDLRSAAFMASAVAAALILVYISFRFELRSGVAAVAALLHDLLVVLSAYVIFQIPFNMNFIAAALTILGYSINATIVVFDRIRENMKLDVKAEFGEVVDISIKQTLGRSINTTVTTLLPVVMILILGVESVQNFALTLVIGMVAGAYSSIFISAPLWNKLRGLGGKKQEMEV